MENSNEKPVIDLEASFKTGYKIFQQLFNIIQTVQTPLENLQQLVANLEQTNTQGGLQQNLMDLDPYGLKLDLQQQINKKSYGTVMLTLVNRFAYYLEFLNQSKSNYFNKDMQYQHCFEIYQEMRQLQVNKSLQLVEQAITQYAIEKNDKNQSILNEIKGTIQSMTELLDGAVNVVSQAFTLGRVNTGTILKPFTQFMDLAFSAGQLGYKIQEQQLIYQKNVEQLKEKGLYQQQTVYQDLLEKLKSLYEGQLWLGGLRLQVKDSIGQHIGLVLKFIKQYQQVCPQRDIKELQEIWQVLNKSYQDYHEIREAADDIFQVIETAYNENIQQQLAHCKVDHQYVQLILLGLKIYLTEKQKSAATGYHTALAYSETCGDMEEKIAQSLLQVSAIRKLEISQRYAKAPWNPLSETHFFRDTVNRMKRWQAIMGQERNEKQELKPSGMIETLIKIYEFESKCESQYELTAEDFIKACLFHLFQAVKEIQKQSIAELLKEKNFKYFVIDWLRYSFYSYYAMYPESTDYHVEFSEMSENLKDLREVLGVKESRHEKSRTSDKRVMNAEIILDVIKQIGTYEKQEKENIVGFLRRCSFRFERPLIVLQENKLLKKLSPIIEPKWRNKKVHYIEENQKEYFSSFQSMFRENKRFKFDKKDEFLNDFKLNFITIEKLIEHNNQLILKIQEFEKNGFKLEIDLSRCGNCLENLSKNEASKEIHNQLVELYKTLKEEFQRLKELENSSEKKILYLN